VRTHPLLPETTADTATALAGPSGSAWARVCSAPVHMTVAVGGGFQGDCTERRPDRRTTRRRSTSRPTRSFDATTRPAVQGWQLPPGSGRPRRPHIRAFARGTEARARPGRTGACSTNSAASAHRPGHGAALESVRAREGTDPDGVRPILTKMGGTQDSAQLPRSRERPVAPTRPTAPAAGALHTRSATRSR
jgi:hypothetical protein